MKVYNFGLTFTQPLLGTAPMDQEIYKNYIADKKAELAEEELETIRDEKGVTGFHVNKDGKPFMYNYMVKGFFKDACGMLRRMEGAESAKLTAYKKIIDGLVFVQPRELVLELSGPITMLQRPLRAQTMQGERVALVSSEMAPVGTALHFRVIVLDDKAVSEKLLREWIAYGTLRGLGQWRNGPYGTFDCLITQESETDSFSKLVAAA